MKDRPELETIFFFHKHFQDFKTVLLLYCVKSMTFLNSSQKADNEIEHSPHPKYIMPGG